MRASVFMAGGGFARTEGRGQMADDRKRVALSSALRSLSSDVCRPSSVLPFAIPRLDRILAGGLPRGALHEVRCSESRDAAAATGFAAAVLARLAAEEARSELLRATGTQGQEARSAARGEERSDRDQENRPTEKQGEEARKAGGLTGKQGDSSRPVLWVVEAAAAHEAGFPYGAGLGRFGLPPARLIVVSVTKPGDALWVFEEGLRCRGLSAVLTEIRGHPRQLDLTASRRLALRAREHGVMGLLLRQSDRAEPGAATTRWLVSPRPAAVTDDYPAGIGRPAWRLTLERNRLGATGVFDVEWDHDRRTFAESASTDAAAADPAHSLPVAPVPFDRPPAPPDAGQVVALRQAS